MAFTQCFDSDGEGLRAYYDHNITRLKEQRFNDDRRIVSLAGLLNQVENHLLDHFNLQELYSVLGTSSWEQCATSLLPAKSRRVQCSSPSL